jgi:predicted TIM-barrel fold metal-dependent hydrolase
LADDAANDISGVVAAVRPEREDCEEYLRRIAHPKLKGIRRMLRIIEESPVPLAALWVFDLPSQNADYNITADNARSYQLREVAEANARVQKGGTPR